MIHQRTQSPNRCLKHPGKPLVLAGLWIGIMGLAGFEGHTSALADEQVSPETATVSESRPAEAAPEVAPDAAPALDPAPVNAPAAAAPEVNSPTAPLESAKKDYYSPEPASAARPLETAPAPAASLPAPAQSDPYIDTKDYSVGATQPYSPPDSVVVHDRSSGCQATLAAGQAVASGLCGVPPTRQLYAMPSRDAVQPAWASVPKNWDSANRGLPSRWDLSQSGSQTASQSAQNSAPYTVAVPRNFSLKPITGTNPLKWILPSGEHMIFPLPIPVDITSAFGWRVHPISGQWSFHSGTDLGAPMGTPVLAAYSGRVSLAEFMGGYGLSILLDHSQGTHETRYAHLSEVFVKPGQWVQQGTVIGLVGSTGNSTGPHLHFEALEAFQGSLVAVDPGLDLQTTMAQLANALTTARLTAQVPTPTQQKKVASLSSTQN